MRTRGVAAGADACACAVAGRTAAGTAAKPVAGVAFGLPRCPACWLVGRNGEPCRPAVTLAHTEAVEREGELGLAGARRRCGD